MDGSSRAFGDGLRRVCEAEVDKTRRDMLTKDVKLFVGDGLRRGERPAVRR